MLNKENLWSTIVGIYGVRSVNAMIVNKFGAEVVRYVNKELKEDQDGFWYGDQEKSMIWCWKQ